MKCDESTINKKSPAAALIKLALQRWSNYHVAADNISVVVVLFEDVISDSSSLSPSISESSVSDSGVDCSNVMPVHRNSTTRKLFSNDVYPSKRRLSTSSLRSKKCKLDNSFQIPATSDQWKSFWTGRGRVGEIMIKSVLQGLDSNQLVEKDRNFVRSQATDRKLELNAAVENRV